MIAHINIGSNLGNRAEQISRAVSFIEPSIGRITAQSQPIESAPWGYDSPNTFLNVGINVDTNLSAGEILKILKTIENEIAPSESHRTDRGEYADRSIDLDLICLDSEIVSTTDLTLPHPRLQEREFVLRPMREILPEWTHPTLGKKANEMISDLHNNHTDKRVK